MRIVIDMQGAQTESRFRGIGRYTLSFAQAVLRQRGAHEVVLALNGLFPDTIEPIRAAFDGVLDQSNIRVYDALGPTREVEPDNDARREASELVREAFLAGLAPDLIHLSSLFEGFLDDAVTSIGRLDRQTPVSVSLYDLIPLLNPAQYLTPNPRYEQHYLRKIAHLKRATACLAISEFAMREGMVQLDAPQTRFVNVSTAIEACFRPIDIDAKDAAKLRKKLGLARPFVLYTGGGDWRKNLPRLIEAFAMLPARVRSRHDLLLAGKLSEGVVAELEQHAKTAGLGRGKLLFTDYVSDNELVQLYNLCSLYVFPSWHEGFGLPALEAMACGAPVIGANTSSLPEVIGLEAALFDPFDVNMISAKIAQGLEDEPFRTSLREHGLQRAELFSWDETAKYAWDAWQSLVEPKSPKPIDPLEGKQKPRLAFVSPLPPERTGIADYSAELLPALAAHYEIEIIVDQAEVNEPWINRHGNVRDVQWLRTHAQEVDRVLYHIGNSTFHQHMLPLLQEIPGTVVLHDFYVSSLMEWLEGTGAVRGAWTQALYRDHGYIAVSEQYLDPKLAVRKYPVNLSILQRAQGLIVHSENSRQLVQRWYGSNFSESLEVIPHIRTAVDLLDNADARGALGIDKEDFVVCSFGFLGPAKLNDRLLRAWLDSALCNDTRSRLIFVGEPHGGDYGAQMLKAMKAAKCADRIRITGFASPSVFHQYLIAADLAVQLRTDSRGETSGTVLDCMNHAIPVIVNANGSMTELDPDAVWMLPDAFTNRELVEALETLAHDREQRRQLGKRSRRIILDRHAPEICSNRYAVAIERFHAKSQTSTHALTQAIAAQPTADFSATELLELSASIGRNQPLLTPVRRLWLDLTATCHDDLRTGIQRVARALTLALLNEPPEGFRVEPAYLSNAGGTWRHFHARCYTLGLLGCPSGLLDDEPVEPAFDDVVVVLDISGEPLSAAQDEGLFSKYRNHGIKVYSLVFDLLPVLMPEVFPPDADRGHVRWLKSISNFDGALCISKSVADDLTAWQKQAGLTYENRRPFNIEVLPLGADMDNSFPTRGIPANAKNTLRQFEARPTFLMVGTIEPRKGYLQVIEAFRRLWASGIDVNLVIVGKEGWTNLPDAMRRDIPQTLQRLRTLPEIDKRLFWFDGASDEYLLKIYAASDCLIAASRNEGFGLPLIEAAQHELPIIARDIPVFREVAGEHAFYFTGDEPAELMKTVTSWLKLYRARQHPKSDDMPWVTWRESAKRLVELINDPNLRSNVEVPS